MNDESNWYGPNMATFGDRVAAARELTGLTQNALARKLGVKPATLRAWEEDLSEPRANRLAMLAGMLNVSMMWLINGEGEGIEPPSDDTSTSSDMADILAEIREIRTDMQRKTESLGRLEKRIRRWSEGTPIA